MVRARALAIVVSLSLFGSLAQAQDERAPVSLSLAACPGFSPERVRSIVAAELGALLVGDAADPGETTAVTVTCDAEMVTLHVVDPVTGKTLERRIAQSSLHPVARERFLALAIVELVAASWIELAVTPEPAVEPADRTASETTREQAREAATVATAPPEGTVRVSLLGAISLVGSPLRGSFGGGARVDHEPDPLLGWSLALWGEHAEASTALGGIAIDQLGGQLEGTLRARLGIATIQGAVGARGTVVLFSGDPGASDVTARSFVAPALGPHGALRLWLEPAPPFYLMLGATFTWTLLAAHALVDGARAVSVDGPALIGELGLGFRVD